MPHRVLTGFYGLNDAQEAVFPKMSTCYANENSYRSWDGDSNPRPITIDYIMYKSTFATKVSSQTFVVKRPKVIMHATT